MTVTEKVSYLKGLAEGLGIDESEKNGKMIKAIIDVLEDIGLELEEMKGYLTHCLARKED